MAGYINARLHHKFCNIFNNVGDLQNLMNRYYIVEVRINVVDNRP
jgi:hypothetical protein